MRYIVGTVSSVAFTSNRYAKSENTQKSEKNVNILQKGVFRFYTRIGCEYATDEMVIFSYVNLFPGGGALKPIDFYPGCVRPNRLPPVCVSV